MWKVVRADVRRLTVAGRDDIWIVASASHPAHAVACVGASRAAHAAADFGTPTWMVPVKAAVRRARERFERIVAEQDVSTAVTPLTRRRRI